ncbi:CAP domain-containing protein [Streptodolium elevatio]|uniref:CAP domain-containing protein n=1 Tax=Streptodolium elevatio TaxID=3157996 RepID=A0ABV3DSB7_9ACTN
MEGTNVRHTEGEAVARHSRRSTTRIRARRGHRRRRRLGPLRVAAVLLGIALAVGGTRLSLDLLDDGGSGADRTAPADATAATSSSGGPDRPPSGGPSTPEAVAGGPGAAVSTSPQPSSAAPPAATPPSLPVPSPGTPSEPSPATTGPATPQPTAPAPSLTPKSLSPAPTTTAPGGTGTAYEDEVLALVNAERAAAGCGPAQADAALRGLARAHSDDMADRGYFAHDTPDGKSPWDRAKAAGIDYLAAENIARGQATPKAVMEAWMNSEGHRANILNCGFGRLGVGVRTGSGGPWWTQEFGR